MIQCSSPHPIVMDCTALHLKILSGWFCGTESNLIQSPQFIKDALTGRGPFILSTLLVFSRLCPLSHLYFRLYVTENVPDLSLSIYILNIKEQPIINQNTYVTSDEERMTNRDMIVPTSSIHPYRVSRLIHLQIQTQTQTQTQIRMKHKYKYKHKHKFKYKCK